MLVNDLMPATGLRILALAAALASTAIALAHAETAAKDDWPPGAPRGAAAIVNAPDRPQVAVVDLVSGTVRPLASAGATEPTWSPNGALLAFQIGSALHLFRAEDGQERVALGGVPRPTRVTV